MKLTEYAGINYGRGTTANLATDGHSYGVISRNTLDPECQDSIEYDYGDPCCPDCGEKATEVGDFDYTAECGVEWCANCKRVAYPMEIEEGRCPECAGQMEEVEFKQHHDRWCNDYVCHACKLLFSSEDAFPEEPVGYHIDCAEVKAIDCLDTDWMVTDSKFITRAQYCSPCVPQAGNLDAPCLTGPITLCFGHQWFEKGKAPYPVVSRDAYNLSQGEIIRLIASDETWTDYPTWEAAFEAWQKS